MDRVRFGRALGYGARHAAKTLTQAIDASRAPNSSAKAGTAGTKPRAAPPRPATNSPRTPTAPLHQRTAEAIDRLQTTHRQAKRASGSLLKPVKRFSGIVWLQVSGVFFSLFALTMAAAAWRARAAFRQPIESHAAIRLYICLAVFALFTYFAVSSFIRAERR